MKPVSISTLVLSSSCTDIVLAWPPGFEDDSSTWTGYEVWDSR